jgi:excinuclease UvrABC helicase subunit UvrB
MTNAKLFEKLRNLTKNTKNVDKEHIKSLRKVLRKLKTRQHELADECQAAENDHDRQKIEQDIEVLKLQRKKGVEVYKRLKKERKERNQ